MQFVHHLRAQDACLVIIAQTAVQHALMATADVTITQIGTTAVVLVNSVVLSLSVFTNTKNYL